MDLKNDTNKKNQWPRTWLVGLIILAEFCERTAFHGNSALITAFLESKSAFDGVGSAIQAVAAKGFLLGQMKGLGLPSGFAPGLRSLQSHALNFSASLTVLFPDLRKSMLLGALIVIMGHITMKLCAPLSSYIEPLTTLKIAFGGLMGCGSGLLRASLVAVISQQFQPGDKSRETSFFYYYAFLNVGGLLGGLILPIIARLDWGLAFMFGIIAMLIAGGVIIFTVPKLSYQPVKVLDFSIPNEKTFKQRLLATAFFIFVDILFYVTYFPGDAFYSTVCRNIAALNVFGFEVPIGWMDSLNALFAMTFAPLFQYLNIGSMSYCNRAAVGAFLVGLSHLIFAFRTYFIDGPMNILYPLLYMTVFTAGEAFMAVVIVSSITGLVPKRFLTVGIMLTYVARSVGIRLSGFPMQALSQKIKAQTVAGSLPVKEYASTFLLLFVLSVLTSVFVLIMKPIISKLQAAIDQEIAETNSQKSVAAQEKDDVLKKNS